MSSLTTSAAGSHRCRRESGMILATGRLSFRTSISSPASTRRSTSAVWLRRSRAGIVAMATSVAICYDRSKYWSHSWCAAIRTLRHSSAAMTACERHSPVIAAAAARSSILTFIYDWIAAVQSGITMSNKPHQHPHKQKWHARPATRMFVAVFLIALFLVGLALSASGHPVLLR